MPFKILFKDSAPGLNIVLAPIAATAPRITQGTVLCVIVVFLPAETFTVSKGG